MIPLATASQNRILSFMYPFGQPYLEADKGIRVQNSMSEEQTGGFLDGSVEIHRYEAEDCREGIVAFYWVVEQLVLVNILQLCCQARWWCRLEKPLQADGLAPEGQKGFCGYVFLSVVLLYMFGESRDFSIGCWLFFGHPEICHFNYR